MADMEALLEHIQGQLLPTAQLLSRNVVIQFIVNLF